MAHRFRWMLLLLATGMWLAIQSFGFIPVFAELSPDGSITFTAVGDVIMHSPVVNAALDSATGTYDFRPAFRELKDTLSRADFATAVMESPLAGPGVKYSGYPRFNGPVAVAEALGWTGVDLLFTAHNHSLDQGESGIIQTVACLNKTGLYHTGLRNDPSRERFILVEIKGLKLAFLSYTTITNGLPVPKGKGWMINTYDERLIAADIHKARTAGADGIILALHSGTEYRREPASEEKAIFYRLLELGVDIVLGSHVHVIQPLEYHETMDPVTGARRSKLIVYSLGNLLSNQRWRYSDCGLLVSMTLRKAVGEGLVIDWFEYKPLWVHLTTEKGRKQYRVKLLDGPEVTDPTLTASDRERIKEVWEETHTLIREWGNKNKP